MSKYHQLIGLPEHIRKQARIEGGTLVLAYGHYDLLVELPYAPKMVHTHVSVEKGGSACGGTNAVDVITWVSDPEGIRFICDIQHNEIELNWVAAPHDVGDFVPATMYL